MDMRKALLLILGTLVLLAANADTALAKDDITPLPPVWPNRFKIDFDEETYITWWTFKTAGKFYYDADRNMSRVDRENGIGDRYCGSAYPLRNTPCTHLVRDNVRFLIFPEHNYCCKCCSDGNGCGITRPDWLANSTYQGQDTIFGIKSNKWLKSGLQNNYYWHAVDQTPVRIIMEFTEQMTFRHDSYEPMAKIDKSTFDYPKDMDCSVGCYGLCAIASPSDGVSSLGSRKVFHSPLIRQVA